MFSVKDLKKDRYTVADICRLLSVKPATLRLWERKDKCSFLRSSGNQRYLDRERMISLLIQEGRLPAGYEYLPKERKDILYCRVSSHDQKKHGDLDRQAVWLMNHAKNLHNPEVIMDVGSGLDENRKGYMRLLDMVLSDEVSAVYVTYRDRLTRFGFRTLEKVFAAHGTEITALQAAPNKEAEKELRDDMMSLIASFSGKLYGLRSKKK